MSELDRINHEVVFAGPDGSPFTTSLVVATDTGNEHASVIKLVRENAEDLAEVGTLRFEIAKSGGRPTEYAILDEPASALLMTYLRNTPEIKDFKKHLVAGFYAMRQALIDNFPAAGKVVETLTPLEYAKQLVAAEERVEAEQNKNKVLTSRIEKDAPLVAKAEAHTGNAKAINRQMFAREVQAWGVKQNISILQGHVYEMLRRKGMLIDGQRSDRNHATAQAVKAGWAWTHKDITEDGYPTAVTLINPRGQDIAWKWITEYVRDHGNLVLPPKISGAA